MAANRTRVQVRGSIGKSVHLPAAPTSGGATIGVNLRLPNGTIPTLQQLAAALATGAATQDMPGNITPPGGGGAQALVWQNIQYVPANVLYPPRAITEDEPEDVRIIPGPAGRDGVIGVNGQPGATIYPDDVDDVVQIPGPPGPAGNAGPQGSQGAPGVTIPMYPDDGEDALPIPGPAGAKGAAGAAGVSGVTVFMYPDDAEDATVTPGPPGPAGASGGGGGAAANITPDTHPTIPTIYDDEFEVGTVVDTAGTRFAGASPWTAYNLSTGSSAVNTGSLALLPALTGSLSVNGYTQPLVGATWEYTCRMQVFLNAPGALGMIISVGAGKMWHFNVVSATTIEVQSFNSPTSFNGTAATATIPNNIQTPVYLRIGYDGTNLTFSYSTSGNAQTYITLVSTTLLGWLGSAPTLAGLAGQLQSVGPQNIGIFDWFRKTA